MRRDWVAWQPTTETSAKQEGGRAIRRPKRPVLEIPFQILKTVRILKTV